MKKDSTPSSTEPKPIAFISYRHGDGAGYSILLHRELTDYYGDHRIFMDINIEPGDDWVEVIEKAVASCEALVAVIGKDWLTMTIKGRRRLDDPEDRLRLEILTALERNIKVFPILVDGADMPKESELPEPIVKLARRQAIEVRRLSWKYDFGRLITALDNVSATKAIQTTNHGARSPESRKEQITLPFGKRLFSPLARKSPAYWIRVLILITAGLSIGSRVDNTAFATQLRASTLRFLQALTPKSTLPHHTALVLIGDDEYWSAALGGRAPMRRDYLARLVRELEKASPAVIALDFDLHSTSVDGQPLVAPEYEQETKFLLEEIRMASARGTTVVLSRTLAFHDDQYVTKSDIYNDFEFGNGQVRTGFTLLPDDVRSVPLDVTLRDGRRIDSFAVAAIRAYKTNALEGIDFKDSIYPYAIYVRPEAFSAVSSSKILNENSDADWREALKYKIVIVGGNWHTNGDGQGPIAASFDTPVGMLSAPFIHANYIEAILDGRTYSPIDDRYLIAAEFVLALIIALVFALEIQPQFKLGIIMLLNVLLIVSSYLSWQALDLWLNIMMPVMFLGGSLLVDQILEWRMLAKARLESPQS